jgi:hypothetical protein
VHGYGPQDAEQDPLRRHDCLQRVVLQCSPCCPPASTMHRRPHPQAATPPRAAPTTSSCWSCPALPGASPRHQGLRPAHAAARRHVSAAAGVALGWPALPPPLDPNLLHAPACPTCLPAPRMPWARRSSRLAGTARVVTRRSRQSRPRSLDDWPCQRLPPPTSAASPAPQVPLCFRRSQ